METDCCPTCNRIMNLDCHTYIHICRYCQIELPATADMVDRDATTTSAPQLESVKDTSIYIGRCYGNNNLNYLNNWHKSPQLKMIQMMTREFNQISMGKFNNNIIQMAIELFIEINNLLDQTRSNRNIVRALPRRKLIIACICNAFSKKTNLPISHMKFAKIFNMKTNDIRDGLFHLQTLGIELYTIPIQSEVNLVFEYLGSTNNTIKQIITLSTPRILSNCIGHFNQTTIIVALTLRLLNIKITPEILTHFDISHEMYSKINTNISKNMHMYFTLGNLRDIHNIGGVFTTEEIAMLVGLL